MEINIIESAYMNILEQIELEQELFEKMCIYDTHELLNEEVNLNGIFNTIKNIITSFIDFLDVAIRTISNKIISQVQIEENKKVLEKYKNLNVIPFDSLKPTRIIPAKIKEYEKKYNAFLAYTKVMDDPDKCIDKINSTFGIHIKNIGNYREEVKKTLFPDPDTEKNQLRKIQNSNIDEYEDFLKSITSKIKNSRDDLVDYRSDLKKKQKEYEKSTSMTQDKETIDLIKKDKSLLIMRFDVARTIISTHISLYQELRSELMRIFKMIISVSDKDRGSD